MAKTDQKTKARAKRVRRIRKKITGSSEQPRLRVFKSNKHIYAQIIDDSEGKTLVSMSTIDKNFQGSEGDDKTASAKKVGLLLAEAAKNAGVSKVVFDRGGYIYHGRVKSLSEGAREGGLQF
ncbi:LSU ribosomal protein L18P [Desulfocapsa sulfexigens DSM 10523]|uniref:Large ribosomal subunit protein uL18 n=1 Tax=Desulfocapsa sulfexigens (strain DSM 10523 / SB164P1) TaxID=1167006 RepID=M1PQD2_DESSD|nr:50S ribosomal protein L18 [Desulfocapsa sulfexigens]AGF78606.1 LSU ribosomal protein L18P [Desulfocapsa sulfexigens DSM 10523]